MIEPSPAALYQSFDNLIPTTAELKEQSPISIKNKRMQRTMNLTKSNSKNATQQNTNYYRDLQQSYHNSGVDYSVPQALIPMKQTSDSPTKLLEQISAQSPNKYPQRISTAFQPAKSPLSAAKSPISQIITGLSTLKNPRESSPPYNVQKKVISPRPEHIQGPSRKFNQVIKPKSKVQRHHRAPRS